MQNIFFQPSNKTALNEMLKIANHTLHNENNFFYLNESFNNSNLPNSKNNKIKFYYNNKLKEDIKKIVKRFQFTNFIKKPLYYLLVFLIKLNISSIFSEIYLKFSIRSVKKIITNKKQLYFKLLKKQNINLIIISSERSFDDLILISVSKKLKIKSVVVPVSFHASPDILIYSRKNWKFNAKYFSTIKSNKKTFFTDFDNKKYFFYEAAVTKCLLDLNLMIEDPWSLGGGESDVILVESKWHLQNYNVYKPQEYKIKISGHLIYDEIFKDLKKSNILKINLFNKYKLDKTKKIVILSLPQFIEDREYDGFGHSFEEAKAEMEFLLREVSSINENIIISLHPKMELNNYKYIQEKFKVTICDENIENIITTCDLFISWSSSTIAYAIISNRPAIILNYKNEKFDFFEEFKNTIQIKDKKLIASTIQNNITQTSKLKKCKNYRNIISTFDGKASQRIKNYLLK